MSLAEAVRAAGSSHRAPRLRWEYPKGQCRDWREQFECRDRAYENFQRCVAGRPPLYPDVTNPGLINFPGFPKRWAMRRIILFFSGWSDFLMTIAEALLPHFGMYRLARYIAEKHYASDLHGPGARESVLARIHESAGDIDRAEEYYMRAVELRPGFADFQMFFGSFLTRQRRNSEAIAVFERARALVQDDRTVASINATLAELRGKPAN